MTSIPVRSMTGFGEAERAWEHGTVRIEIRSVNHRHLAVQLRAPSAVERYGGKIERALRDHFARGQLNVSVAVGRLATAGDMTHIQADVARAKGYVEALRSLQRELGLEGQLDVSVLARFRDVFREEDPTEAKPEVPEAVLMGTLGDAARVLRAMREEEGGALATDLAVRLAAMEAQLGEVEALAPARLVAERDRLRAAIAKLLDGQVTVDEERIAREVAHMAERWDIHEEIVRFRSHVALFRETLRAGAADGVGKRLGFVAQELLREVNTMGSKANDVEISRRVVALKEEIDRVREQVENVE